MMDQKENRDSLESRKRRLLFRATHRGTYEMDLLIGKYAAIYVPAMTEKELTEFEHILTLSDIDLTAWLSGSQSVPEQEASSVLQAMLEFARVEYHNRVKRG